MLQPFSISVMAGYQQIGERHESCRMRYLQHPPPIPPPPSLPLSPPIPLEAMNEKMGREAIDRKFAKGAHAAAAAAVGINLGAHYPFHRRGKICIGVGASQHLLRTDYYPK